MKREFLQLAQKYDAKKHFVANWYLSEKLDGIRCFYDGGISTGIPAAEIPWANVQKDGRLRDQSIATGLWSRYGKVIHAPDWWLNFLPRIPLDGELWISNGSWQKLTSIVKKFNKGNEWDQVKFMVLDAPPLCTVFEDGHINNTNYKKNFNLIISWIKAQGHSDMFVKPEPFIFIYERLKQRITENTHLKIHEQKQIPMKGYQEYVESELKNIVDNGGEGVIIKNPMGRYTCERSWNVLKYKPYLDDEGYVLGYRWGKETELGSKLLGLMGSMIVGYMGKQFELSGFTDAERKMIHIIDKKDAHEVGEVFPGEVVSHGITNPMFPIGSKITFRFRELSDSGVPKEGRYLRTFSII